MTKFWSCISFILVVAVGTLVPVSDANAIRHQSYWDCRWEPVYLPDEIGGGYFMMQICQETIMSDWEIVDCEDHPETGGPACPDF